MNNSLPHHTAIVLGGGGSTGNAWLIGVTAGLLAGGLDVTDADLIIGTSAGATAAAQILGSHLSELYASTFSEVYPHRPTSAAPVIDHLERTGSIIAAASDPANMRRRMGAAARELAEASGDSGERWRTIVSARLPSRSWPLQRVLITAVDATTGESVAFDLHSGVDLVDAVAASTSGGSAYRIDDNWYIDGGYRSNAENADLAAGYERVLVLSPFGGRTRFPLEWRLDLATQVDRLRATGSRVETIFPESSAQHLFGPNGMDLTLRPDAARAGYEQGSVQAGHLIEFWS